MPKKTDIEAALHEVERAQETLRRVVAAKYPIGSRVGFDIMHGQINLSWGIVDSISNDAYLHVKVETKRGYRHVYYQHIHQVITPD